MLRIELAEARKKSAVQVLVPQIGMSMLLRGD